MRVHENDQHSAVPRRRRPSLPPTSPPALPRSTPEAQGVSSAAILAFVEAAEKDIDALHSFMLVRHGHVVAEGWWAPYDATTRTCCTR